MQSMIQCKKARNGTGRFLAEIKPSFVVPKGQGGRRQRPAPDKPDFNYLYSKKEPQIKVSVREGDAVIHKKYGRVLSALSLKLAGKTPEEKLSNAVLLYERIVSWYGEFQKTERSKVRQKPELPRRFFQ